jgi:hypothetical protein
MALPWTEKAYNLDKNDRDNNVMYYRILARLQKLDNPVLEELKEKVDSYYQKQ